MITEDMARMGREGKCPCSELSVQIMLQQSENKIMSTVMITMGLAMGKESWCVGSCPYKMHLEARIRSISWRCFCSFPFVEVVDPFAKMFARKSI